MINTFITRRILSFLESSELLDRWKLKEVLQSTHLGKYGNFGYKTYLYLCVTYHVKPLTLNHFKYGVPKGKTPDRLSYKQLKRIGFFDQ